MIDRQALLADLQKLLRQLEKDLRDRCDEVPDIDKALRAEYSAAKEAERTADSFEEWRADYITQIAAAWVLTCVFARFLEDNCLVDPPKLSGPGERLRRARDEHELYFRAHPTHTDREYLLDVFDGLARLPDGEGIFAGHNPLRQQPGWLSGDAARALMTFFQQIDPETKPVRLIHDFADPQWDTRFLGDLYQDLSEDARKKYALLQTPEFVEEFILDRTLDPAIKEFGLDGFRMIDPACGSGHFLLGSFRRLLRHWQEAEPGTSVRELVQRSLDSVHGVDINPYAVAIARFRLLLAALHACETTRLADAPAFRLNIVCGDSLLHGVGAQASFGWHDFDHVYQTEDAGELNRILKPGHYHTVVANPPYITPKDKALNDAYRERYSTCYRQYSLAVPFMQRLFQLAASGYGDAQRRGGFVGQITANSFMKREFGKKLIEEYFAGHGGTPGVDLAHVIDTAGAYIPGHGTPTVILFGRNRAPMAKTIRTVLGIRGEPATPSNPAEGQVWTAILQQIDLPGSQSEFVSVADTARENFHRHPWSIGGGGAAELRQLLDRAAESPLGDVVQEIGFGAVTRDDDAFVINARPARRLGIEGKHIHKYVVGEQVRDWSFEQPDAAIWPYDAESLNASGSPAVLRFLWRFRRQLCDRVAYGQTQLERGLKWFEYSMFFKERFRSPLLLTFACVATQNNFVLTTGRVLFNRHAPIIKLPAANGTEEQHVAILGLLNSSVACFWMKQIFHNKGSTVDQHGARQRTAAFEDFYEHDGTKLKQFPVPVGKPLELTRKLTSSAQRLSNLSPSMVVGTLGDSDSLRFTLNEIRQEWEAVRQQMIALQEDLDWECYHHYGLIDEDLRYSGGSLPSIHLGERAFEIVMARKMVAGELQTTWFERHSSRPIPQLPADWPEDYRRLVERRIELIETDRNISLIEQPEYKRRWNTERWDEQLQRALQTWLLDRLESYFDHDGRMNEKSRPTARVDMALVSTTRVADVAAKDPDFMQVAELYRGRSDFDVAKLVAELVEGESVPLLPVLRYKATGLDKRQAWERTWELQRAEDGNECELKRMFAKDGQEPDADTPISYSTIPWEEVASLLGLEDGAVEAQSLLPQSEEIKFKEIVRRVNAKLLGDIPVPPKYTSADFLPGPCWRLRGKLDVPKERWVSFPHCEGEDDALVVTWGGLDHLQLAQAIGAYHAEVQQRGGAADPRLVPLLGCILELIPWLKQWHNEPDPNFNNMRMGDYFADYVEQEARGVGLTLDNVRAWKPPKKNGKGKGPKKQGKKKEET